MSMSRQIQQKILALLTTFFCQTMEPRLSAATEIKISFCLAITIRCVLQFCPREETIFTTASTMLGALLLLARIATLELQSSFFSHCSNILPLTKLFELKNEIYKPRLQYTSKKLNEILQSLLHERAMKMDSSYVDALVWHEPTKPAHADVLAFDIQRGRDHGLQPYYKYLEICNRNKKITSWSDFEDFIPKEVSY
ncbi:GH23458 [Drosophila grimshawi]|uniref:GH23458 n=1 Tax=Drosophila grimshawi TaxID=7222 RepID=B4K2R0_DROGR|nr:GH23458 [Drosophila grimshawi]